MDSTKPLVAVVDDDQSVLNSMARLLRSGGYAVVTFSSPRAFVESLTTSVPQCLVVDVQMPEMKGFELQSRLRALGHHVPVVFMTAHDSPQTRDLATQGGNFGLLFKPFKAVTLLAAVANAVEHSRI